MSGTAGFECIFCRYDLSGLDRAGVCPECGKAVELSIPRPQGARPLAVWLRALNVAYLTAFATLITWSWLVSVLQETDWKYSWNRDLEHRWLICWMLVWLFGWAVSLLDFTWKHWTRWVTLALQACLSVYLLTELTRSMH